MIGKHTIYSMPVVMNKTYFFFVVISQCPFPKLIKVVFAHRNSMCFLANREGSLSDSS